MSLTSVKQSLGQEAKEIKGCSRDILFNFVLVLEKCSLLFLFFVFNVNVGIRLSKSFILILIGITYFSVINYIFTRFLSHLPLKILKSKATPANL